ncbi:alanine racemase [Alicyclobacillus dauci]|uniref:Alanine racemase n=1 Tax=Alicyclobacillus dauci TaxID=1475485 RepID=A0ABY6Z7F7_9BACL|nr:alanine racemase [Alicyclobacillus dauci]WAH38724.1 alanine racemase [Alicyclobacillus dauci]
MFLKSLVDRNRKFVEAVVSLHEEGALEANTFVFDLDAFRENAKILKENADKFHLNVYGMTKQMGYNPILHQAIVDAGIESFVAVDWMGARLMHEQGYKIGHVGHLVQPPKGAADDLLAMNPEVFTVFSVHKARQVSDAAKRLNVVQPILLRVYDDTCTFYPGHEGGFHVDTLESSVREIQKLPNVEIVGVTSFPAMLFNESAGTVRPTHNFEVIQLAVEKLRRMGIVVKQVNAPGTTSSDVFELMASMGATHVEPGNGFTGTTPLATVQDVQELPAVLYLSEISHIHNGRGHVFGGGLYVDKVRGQYGLKARVGKDLAERDVELIPDDGIDYYGYVDGQVEEGQTVIFGFRPQIFVTRGQVAVVEGIHEGKPVVLGYHDQNGRVIQRGPRQ